VMRSDPIWLDARFAHLEILEVGSHRVRHESLDLARCRRPTPAQDRLLDVLATSMRSLSASWLGWDSGTRSLRNQGGPGGVRLQGARRRSQSASVRRRRSPGRQPSASLERIWGEYYGKLTSKESPSRLAALSLGQLRDQREEGALASRRSSSAVG